MKGKNLKGFTLIEIIAVLFVVSLGLIGVLSLIIQNIQSQSINRRRIIAYQLAQEGIELVRKTRDSNWVNADTWNKDLVNGNYYMDPLDSIPQTLISFDEATLYKNADGLYVHEISATSTPYKRVLAIENLTAYSMRVYSRVIWSDRNKVFNYELETLLYDWY